MLNQIRENLKSIQAIHNRKPMLGWIVLACLLSALSVLAVPKNESLPQARAPESPDTFIPRGHVLVPIDIANFESLDSMIGNYAVVSLYKKGPSGELIGSRVKLIRSPVNPSLFAVLVPEGLGPKFARLEVPVFATIQNPTAEGTSFEVRHSGGARLGLKIIEERVREEI